MDLNLLSQLLRELILDNDHVSLQGIGSFIADIAPAYFSVDGKTINPPYRRIFFRSTELSDDGVLEKYYVEKFNISRSSAKEELSNFFGKIRLDLNVKKSLILPEFGQLKVTKDGNYYFIPDSSLDIYADAFGLEPISVKLIDSTSYTSARNDYKAKSRFRSHTNTENSNIKENAIQNSNDDEPPLISPEDLKKLMEEEGLNYKNEGSDVNTLENIEREEWGESTNRKKIEEKDSVEEKEREYEEKSAKAKRDWKSILELKRMEDGREEEDAEEKEERENEEKFLKAEKDESSEGVRGTTKFSKGGVQSESLQSKMATESKSNSPLAKKNQIEDDPIVMKKLRRIIIILSIVIAVLVIIILMMVFKDQVFNLFKGLLYSKEEIELINSI